MEIALIKSYSDKPWRSPETYQLIENSLKKKWHVKSINTLDPITLNCFLTKLNQEYGESIFVFNIAEYLDENNKQGFLPALLDEWNIPHLGSSAEVVAMGLDKGKTKIKLLENQILTPRYFVAHKRNSEIKSLAEIIGYPLIVKPIKEGGHIGITDDSIVYNDVNLDIAVNRIFDNHNQPALVEEYIIGKEMREFSVGIIEAAKKLFTPVEIDYESMDVTIPILGYESAEKNLERIKLVQDKIIYDEIIDLAEKTSITIGARDYSRVDIRMNHTGSYVLEINVMPGLGPHSFLPEAAKSIHALEYSQLIQELTENSIKRQKKRRIK
jgi:D-alanine-D-alanine ligase